MTTPEFILDLFTDEIQRIQIDLLQKVADKYNLDHLTLISEFIPNKINIISNNQVRITIKKVQETKKIEDNNKCMARVWNRGKGGQCSKKKLENCDYCTIHTKNRKHGRIDEQLDRNKFPTKSTSFFT
jgi:hypothetical protein